MAASRRWFHPDISSMEAEELLQERGYDGCYLVRRSQSNPGDFSLSVRVEGQIIHARIQRCGDLFVYGSTSATLGDLIARLSEGNVMTEKSGSIVELKYALHPAYPTNERWFHGFLIVREAERLLMSVNASSGSYLVRERYNSPGDYALSVRTGENKVTHAFIQCESGKYSIGGGEQFDSLRDLLEHYAFYPMVESSGCVIRLRSPLITTKMTASAISCRVKALKKGSDKPERNGFGEEFEVLLNQAAWHLHSRDIGEKPENRVKNRNGNILPFDYNRVILKDGASYVNASYIDLTEVRQDQAREVVKMLSPDTTKKYIATQGCLGNTIEDFWQMVWEGNSRVIVMLIKQVEEQENKCAKYWPGDYERAKYNKVTVISTGVKQLQVHDRREFRVLHDDYPGEAREVFHYNFNSWPDRGVPKELNSIVEFLEDVYSKPGAGQVIVHGSAGVGRTGTFIMIDVILDLIRHHGRHYELDILNLVLRLRSQRSGMVETVAQYEFIYQAVEHYINVLSQRLGEKQDTLTTSGEYTNDGESREPHSDISQASGGAASDEISQYTKLPVASKGTHSSQSGGGVYQNILPQGYSSKATKDCSTVGESHPSGAGGCSAPDEITHYHMPLRPGFPPRAPEATNREVE